MQRLRRSEMISFRRSHLCGLVLAPVELHQYGIFDTKRIEEIYLAGYDHALGRLEELMPVIEARAGGSPIKYSTSK